MIHTWLRPKSPQLVQVCARLRKGVEVVGLHLMGALLAALYTAAAAAVRRVLQQPLGRQVLSDGLVARG